MSERSRGLPGPILELQRELTASGHDVAPLERIPPDWSLGGVELALVRVAVAFSGTVPAAALPETIRSITHSRRADLAGVAWVLLRLAPHGRAAIVVPASFLDEATHGHRRLRRRLTEQGRLHGIVRLSAGVCRPRAAAAVLVLGAPDTGPVWFCDVLDGADLAPPSSGDAGGMPVAVRWRERHRAGADQPRSGPSFFVPRAEIAAAQFDWSFDRHRGGPDGAPAPLRPPHEILTELAALEAEIFQGLRDLVGSLKR